MVNLFDLNKIKDDTTEKFIEFIIEDQKTNLINKEYITVYRQQNIMDCIYVAIRKSTIGTDLYKCNLTFNEISKMYLPKEMIEMIGGLSNVNVH